MATPFLSQISRSLQLQFMHVPIAKRFLQKLVTFKDTAKHVLKGEQLSIVQTSRSNSRTPLTREHSMQRIIYVTISYCMAHERKQAAWKTYPSRDMWEWWREADCASSCGWLCFNTTVATGTGAHDVALTTKEKS